MKRAFLLVFFIVLSVVAVGIVPVVAADTVGRALILAMAPQNPAWAPVIALNAVLALTLGAVGIVMAVAEGCDRHH
ncbi:hypothetical protein COW81_00760 [Candidatus Campbellbacteria bacterium CG22_combo_CG10-13_8_21_14_all_36_13]|uniref:Uncharacterized protein n=1 Tax=Candidatus Campbellbacteria bacterium CG22_combo_CG10-13_8_21_14_all_36_13 TaxID=1974529 RepID=A0A2H0DYT4_9BACT|nr:MAG: hypothetical protein COW81_00760 [Candidatus Campbellbacteria bacterium CG22_combo_CG10-13_8_21_14_all_36_13]